MKRTSGMSLDAEADPVSTDQLLEYKAEDGIESIQFERRQAES